MITLQEQETEFRQGNYLLRPFVRLRNHLWGTRCVCCSKQSPGVPEADDLAAFGALWRARWSYIALPHRVYLAVCPACAVDPSAKLDGRAVSQLILPRDRRS